MPVAVRGRIRAATRPGRKQELLAKGLIPAIKKEMELHLEAAKDYLSIDYHKFPSTYTPTYEYQDSWEASPIRDTSSGLIGTLRNGVQDKRGRFYAEFVAGTETEESPQAGDWVGPWNQLVDAIRGIPGELSFRQKIQRVIRSLS